MYTIKIHTEDLKVSIDGLSEALKDLTPITRSIAGILEKAAERSFLQEESPEGEAWQPLTPKYKNMRAKEGSLGRILDRSHTLRRTLSSDFNEKEAIVGVNSPYGAIHQYGGKIDVPATTLKQHYVRTKKGLAFASRKKTKDYLKASFGMANKRKAYTVTMPARPYLGLGATDEADMIELIISKLEAALSIP